MNAIMQNPLSYPLPMDALSRPLVNPRSSNSFSMISSHYPKLPFSYPFPSSLPPMALAQPQNPYTKMIPMSPYSNRRYQHLKQMPNYSNRRSRYRPNDTRKRHHRHSSYDGSVHSENYIPSKTKSISNLEHTYQTYPASLSKAHSWHAISNGRRSNLSVVYAQEMQLSTNRYRKRSSLKMKQPPSPRRLPTVSPKRNPSLTKHRQRSVPVPECGIVRISTLDEMPICSNQTNKRASSMNNDRSSMKGNAINYLKQQQQQQRSKENNSVKDRYIKSHKNTRKNSENEPSLSFSLSSSLSSSSLSSHRSNSSAQERINDALRNDPLISAAMEDFRKLVRTSSQNLSIVKHRNHHSLSSNSTSRSSIQSRSNSQTSFTSLERSEIRELIKTVKNRGTTSVNVALQEASPPTVVLPEPEPITTIDSRSASRPNRPRKSSITEKLDREFDKLRSRKPNNELLYVTPSSMCKRRKTLERPPDNTAPAPKFDELLRQVQLRPVKKSPKSVKTYPAPVKLRTSVPIVAPVPVRTPSPVKQYSTDDIYENPLSLVPVPRRSPTPVNKVEPKAPEPKHEYSFSVKDPDEKPLPQISHFQPTQIFSLKKPISSKKTIEKQSKNVVPTFNWPQYEITASSMPSTFQPNSIPSNHCEPKVNTAKENIYTADVNVHLPSSDIDKNENDPLQIHLDNQTIITDDYYCDFGQKQTTFTSSIIDDFSTIMKLKHKHQYQLHKKSQRCSLM